MMEDCGKMETMMRSFFEKTLTTTFPQLTMNFQISYENAAEITFSSRPTKREIAYLAKLINDLSEQAPDKKPKLIGEQVQEIFNEGIDKMKLIYSEQVKFHETLEKQAAQAEKVEG